MSIEDEPKDSPHRAEKKRQYRKAYWERFAATRKRVFGTLTLDEYTRIEERAKKANRAVWAQIHAEAEAYARGEYLPPKDVEERIVELIVQLRRIGNNINQIARALNTESTLNERDLVEDLHDLETTIRAFTKKPWGTPNDGEP